MRAISQYVLGWLAVIFFFASVVLAALRRSTVVSDKVARSDKFSVRHFLIVAASSLAVLALYVLGYWSLTWRDNGYARHANEFDHYRYVNHAREYYLFMPAVFVESRIICLYPLPFLPHPSWASEPQVVIY